MNEPLKYAINFSNNLGLWPKTLWYEALKTQICLFPIMHLNDIPIAATLRKLPIAAPFSHTRPQRRLSHLVRCGKLQITSEFTDSPLKLPVLLTIERYWTHYYSAEREEGEKKQWCGVGNIQMSPLQINYSLPHSRTRKQMPPDFCRSFLCSQNPIFFSFFICFFISFLPLTVHHEEPKCILI